MTKWWNALHALQQATFVIACAATLFMIGQVVLLALSGESETGVAADGDGDESALTVFGLKVLSVRSVIAFLAVGCWLTFALFYAISYYAIIPGVAAGTAAAFAIAAFIRAMERLQENGNPKVESAVGKTAEVCAPIPPLRSGSGKVRVVLEDRSAELEAVCDSAAPLKVGEPATVVRVLTEGTVVVEPLVLQDKAEQTAPEQADS